MTEDDRTVTVRVPLVFKKHGGRKTVITPDGNAWEPPAPLVDRALVEPWPVHFDGGCCSTRECTRPSLSWLRPKRLAQSFVSRVLRLTLLAPDVVEAVLDGQQPAETRLDDLLNDFPIEWEAQRAKLGGQSEHHGLHAETQFGTICRRQRYGGDARNW